jgi:hypothetical protein
MLAGDLPGNGQCVVQCRGTPWGALPGGRDKPRPYKPLRQRLALNQLHCKRAHAVRFFKSVNRRNVGMVERSKDLCFALEARHAVRIAGKNFRQDFQRYVAAERGVAGSIDLPHAART